MKPAEQAFFVNLSLGIIFLDLPQLSVSLNVQMDRTACLHTLNTYLNTLLRSCTVVLSPYQLFNAKKGWRKWLVCVLRWFLGRMIPLRQAIRFHINLWQECRRPNTCRPAADEAPLTQEKISGTQGNRNDTYVVKFSPCPPPPPPKKKITKCHARDREKKGTNTGVARVSWKGKQVERGTLILLAYTSRKTLVKRNY